MDDHDHEAHGAMIHRGLVEQREYKMQQMRDEIAHLIETQHAMIENKDQELHDLRGRVTRLDCKLRVLMAALKKARAFLSPEILALLERFEEEE